MSPLIEFCLNRDLDNLRAASLHGQKNMRALDYLEGKVIGSISIARMANLIDKETADLLFEIATDWAVWHETKLKEVA